MPHDHIPEGWVDTAIYLIITAITGVAGFLARVFLGRVAKVEEAIQKMDGRLITLERIAAVQDERHRENRERLQRIERKLDHAIGLDERDDGS